MAGSPFDVFRRNQRQMMVLLTCMAMFAFVFLDSVSMQSGQLPRSLGVILVSMLCAGGLWVVGSPRGRGGELALYGALIGGVVAFFGLGTAGRASVAQTSLGSFDRDDLQRFAQRRSTANRFVAAATKDGRNGFGGTDNQSLVQRAILLKEAAKRGVKISNEGVTEYILKITNNKLSKPDYKDLLRNMGVPESELFSILREELAAKLVFEMDLPPALQDGTGPLSTPLTYWKQYKMLQVRQSLDVTAIPVEPFMAKVPEPNDAELQQFFSRYKNVLPDGLGAPGFLQNRKVNIAYVAADFEAFEKKVTEPTAEEVAAYYEANKQRYPVVDIPDSPEEMQDESADEAPASATEPLNTTEPPTLPGPEGAPTPEAAAPAAAAPADPAKPAPEKAPAPSEARRTNKELTVQPVAFLQETPPAATTETPATEKPAEPAATTEAPAAPTTPAPATPEATPPAATNPELPPAAAEPSLGLPPSPGSAPEQKYRALDEGLKLEIRETILRERAFEAMGNAVEQAFNEMTTYSDEYLAVTEPAEQKSLLEKLTQRLKSYAKANNLAYVETGLVTQQQLMSSVSEPIGAATEPSANPFQPGPSVAQAVFDNDSILYPRRADSAFSDKRFAYWKLEDVPPRVPELAEVKEEVVTAWKQTMARPLAEKRAQALAELIQKSGKPMTEALSGQTVTGADDGEALSVRETPRFSWMSLPRNLPMQFNPMFMPPPQLSQVDGVVEPGKEFMETVFEKLGPDQTGVAVNEPKSIYYVVHVKQRDATPAADAENLGLKALQQQFMTEGRTGFESGPYMYFNREQLFELIDKWRKAYESRYEITWDTPLEEEELSE